MEQCEHDERDEIDCTYSSGDIICRMCGKVKEERFPSGVISQKEAANAEMVNEMLQLMRADLCDIFDKLNVRSETLIAKTVAQLLLLKRHMGIKKNTTLAEKQYRAHCTWAVFCAMMEWNVYRSPMDVAKIMGVNRKDLLFAENELVQRGFRTGMIDAAPSEHIGSICDILGMSYEIRKMFIQISQEIEGPFYVHKREKFIYQLFCDVGMYLVRNHPDREKCTGEGLRELRKLLQLPHHGMRKMRLPYRDIVRIMMRYENLDSSFPSSTTERRAVEDVKYLV